MNTTDEGSAVDLGFFDALDPEHVPAFAEAYIDRSLRLAPDIDVSSMRISMLLTRLSRLTSFDMESSAQRPAGLTFSSFYVVALLAVAGPLESSRLAVLSGMSRSAISALTKTLVKDGWLQRNEADSDKRSVVLDLTPVSRQRIPDLFLAVNEREQAWTASLTGAETTELARLLTKMVSHAPKDVRRRR